METTTVQNWYEQTLRERVDFWVSRDPHPAEAREQVEHAMAAAPASAGEVDAWFEEHFHRPPVSHHTSLYNELHAAMGGLKAALEAQAQA